VQSGSWSNPTTWGGHIPTANHVVRIVQGHIVTIDDTSAAAYTIGVDGKLAFARSYDVETGGSYQFWSGMVVLQ